MAAHKPEQRFIEKASALLGPKASGQDVLGHAWAIQNHEKDHPRRPDPNPIANALNATLQRIEHSRTHLTPTESTAEETLLLALLGRHSYIHIKTQVECGPFRIDIAIVDQKIAVEVDGKQHETTEAREYDARRDKFIRDRGWKILRLPARVVYREPDRVADFVADWYCKRRDSQGKA